MTFNLNDILNEKTFCVPNFQRGMTWSTTKKKNFVKTLIDGNPFGTILIYKDNKNNNILIDGLQRITTIRSFYASPYKYVTKEIIDTKLINNLIKNIKRTCKAIGLKLEGVEQRLDFDKIRNYIFKGLAEKKDYTEIKNNLLNYLKINLYPRDTVEIERTLKMIIDDVVLKINIDNLRVYAISYNGDEEKLPEIFYNLNTGGVKPSKYEVLASLWNDVKYDIKDDRLINKVYERYDILKKDSQLKITMTKDELKKNGITLFEYCYAIGTIITDNKNNYVSFLGKSKNTTEPIGFDILSLVLGLKVNEANKLDAKLNNAPAKFLVELKKVIIDGFDHIYDALEDWIFTEQGNAILLRSNYMIYHMFMAYIKMNYDIDCVNYNIMRKKTPQIEKWNNNFKKKLHLHYFFDYMSNYWSEHRQVSDLMNLINNPKELFKYSSDIPDSEWKDMFERFKSMQVKENRGTISNKSKLFLDYLVKFKIKENPNLRRRYFKSKDDKSPLLIDVEHIVPKERIKQIYDIANQPVSLCLTSAIGNLCYLTATVNRGKREKTIYESQEDRPGYIVDETFIEFVNYPKENELQFLKGKFDVFNKGYTSFINNRADKLIKEFMDLKF